MYNFTYEIGVNGEQAEIVLFVNGLYLKNYIVDSTLCDVDKSAKGMLELWRKRLTPLLDLAYKNGFTEGFTNGMSVNQEKPRFQATGAY